MISGADGRLSYMTYPEPWRGPPKQPHELFLRPAPKPLNSNRYPDTSQSSDVAPVFLHYSRYNGVNTLPSNGSRLSPSQPGPAIKYSSSSLSQPSINLIQAKDESAEELTCNSYVRLLSHNTQYSHFPYSVYQQPYMMRPNFPPTPLSPMETFSPLPSNTSAYPSLCSTSGISSGINIVREKLTPPQNQINFLPSQQVPFKVPSGKEGSLKHRILIRPEDENKNGPLDLKKFHEPRKRLQGTMSPPRSPKKAINNNNIALEGFAKGSLVQLANGDLKKIEDMRTEDFLMSIERSAELRLAESTILKIEENNYASTATITLTYSKKNAQIEVESTLEHPYFVIGQGWASCNPERTQQCYRLNVHRLQVGDIIISLTPKESLNQPTTRIGSTYTTTATTTAMTVKQISVNSVAVTSYSSDKSINNQVLPTSLRSPQSLSPNSLIARKRRWSAPDQICDDKDEIKKPSN